jgi:hypothetical protein
MVQTLHRGWRIATLRTDHWVGRVFRPGAADPAESQISVDRHPGEEATVELCRQLIDRLIALGPGADHLRLASGILG